MSRWLLLTVLAVGATGFAPAPLPRERRDDAGQLSLTACQGTWEVLSNESIGDNGTRSRSEWGVKHIRIRGDRWTLLDASGGEMASYSLDVGKGRVAPIDWFPLGRKNARPLWGGLVDRRGDVMRIMYESGDRRGVNRRLSVDSATNGGYIITVRRGSQ